MFLYTSVLLRLLVYPNGEHIFNYYIRPRGYAGELPRSCVKRRRLDGSEPCSSDQSHGNLFFRTKKYAIYRTGAHMMKSH